MVHFILLVSVTGPLGLVAAAATTIDVLSMVGPAAVEQRRRDFERRVLWSKTKEGGFALLPRDVGAEKAFIIALQVRNERQLILRVSFGIYDLAFDL